MVEIREIRTEEYGFLWEMLHEAIYSPDVKLPKSIIYEAPLANYAASFGRTGDYGFVLATDTGLAGAAWVRLLKGENRGYGFVNEETPELSMAIEADFRGKGYGRQMLEKLIEKGAQVGYAQLSLSVDKRNKAFDLYQKAGFVTVSETDGSCIMVRRTTPAN